MSKPRKLGMKSTYIHNAKADMRHNKTIYQRNVEKAFHDNDEMIMAERQAKKEVK